MKHMKTVFLIDCDGTLYRGDTVIEGAVEFINYLNKNDYQYLLITNCPLHSSAELSLKLLKMGMSVQHNKIITSGMVTAYFLKNEFNINNVSILGSEALKCEFVKQKIEIKDIKPNAVVLGYDPYMNYKRLSKAVQMLHEGALLFSTNADNCIPLGDIFVPHTGALTAAVECASGKKAITFGKPQHYMADYCCKLLSVEMSQFVMVGDRLDTDIAFAENLGFPSFLINRELSNVQNLCTFGISPRKIFNNLRELVQFMNCEF